MAKWLKKIAEAKTLTIRFPFVMPGLLRLSFSGCRPSMSKEFKKKKESEMGALDLYPFYMSMRSMSERH